MTQTTHPTLSIIVPVFNEAAGLPFFHDQLIRTLTNIKGITYEILYCNDGSQDASNDVIRALHEDNPHCQIRLITLSRNFGKEYTLTAGIAQAKGDAILMCDGDGQHPVELIATFIDKWRDGAKIVIGVRQESLATSSLSKFFSRSFYRLFNTVSGEKVVPGSTDFRLIDREVADAFLQLSEYSRMTRMLIDWLGYSPCYIEFTANERQHGTAGYNFRKLVRLELDSFISLTNIPLYIFGYLGVVITLLSGLLGASVLLEQVILSDPLDWNFTGTAMLGILILFMIGVVLMSQGMLALYISSVHANSKGRPLYVIDRGKSIGLKK